MIQAIIDNGLKNGLSAQEITDQIVSRHNFGMLQIHAIKRYVTGLVNNTTEQGNSKQSFAAWRKGEFDTTTEETTEQTSKQSSRLQKIINTAKSDFASATDIGGKVKAVTNFLNNATASTASVSKEDMAWYKASKAELEAEGYVFDGEIGREVSDGEIIEIKNRRESDQVPKGVIIIDRVSKPKRLVNGKQVERPIYDVIDGTGTTAERDALAAEVESIKDSMTPQNMKETAPKLAAANKALQDYDAANFTSPIQTEINTKTEETTEEETTEDTTEGKKEVTNAEKTKIAEEIGKARKVKPKNIKGLLDVMGGIFGLNKKQAESASVVGDVIIGNMAKRAGISKDEMYQKIAYQKANLEDIEKLSEKGKVLYQIVGENANLTQVIKDNLATARQMEATEDPKTIKIATGWERGADGKWRYETVDNIPFLKDTVRTINKFIVEEGLDNGTGILGGEGKLILPPELLELYPQLKDVEIFFDREMSEYEGSYYPNKNKIVVGLGVRPENTVRLLLHEIQHAIQEIEGFAKGGNEASSFSIKNDIINEYEKELKERGADTDQNLLNSITRKYITGAKNKDVFLEDAGREENRPPIITNRYTFRKKVGTEKIFGREITKYEDLPKGLTFYKNLAGEVEARNVEKRMNMTSEQRRASILEETEDVARDEQVVLFEADGSLKQESPLFKSTAKEGLSKIQQKAATPEQWVKMITDKGGKGTSQELEWLGLQDYLNEWKKENKSKSVPKEVVEQYINDNQIEIVEVTKGKNNKKPLSQEEDNRYGELSRRLRNGETLTEEEIEERKGYVARENAEIIRDTSSYSSYTLEGGENYREVLLTLPSKSKKLLRLPNKGKLVSNDFSDYSPLLEMDGYTEVEWFSDDYSIGKKEDGTYTVVTNPNNSFKYTDVNTYEDARNEIENEIKRNDSKEGDYNSSHWDESNILAHLRINERTLPNGERVMFIEEVQSDWAQEGKKKGFGKATPVNREDVEIVSSGEWVSSDWDGAEYRLTLNIRGEEIYTAYRTKSVSDESINLAIESQIQRALDAYNNNLGLGRTPDMPYKKTDQWVGMAMRRVMQMAAQEGFDRVAWVTGEQSAERYDLSKQVDKILFEPTNEEGDRYVDVYMPDKLSTFLVSSDGIIISNKNHVIPQSEGKGLDEVIGKELADRILSSESKNTETIENEGLKVGGEGMKTFYNSILPKVTKKEAQRFDKNAKVEVVDFNNAREVKTEENKFGTTFRLYEGGVSIDYATKKDIELAGYEATINGAKKYFNEVRPVKKEGKASQQLSIAITPEMRMNLNNAVPLFQGEQGAMLAEDGKYTIYALTDPNVSTPLHELAHVYEHYLTDSERAVIERWSGHSEGTVEFSESFARGFEKFLAGGKVNNPKLQKIFENFKKWLTEIYNGIKGSNIDIQLNSEMKAIYNKMLGSTEETTEETAPSKKRLDEQIDGIIKKVKDRTSDKADPKKVNKRAFDDALPYLQESKWYEEATDVEREAAVLDLMKKTGIPIRKSMTVKGAINKKFPAKKSKVTQNELTAIKKQMKDFGRGMREGSKTQRQVAKAVGELLTDLKKKGRLTSKQAVALTKAALKVNFLSPKSVIQFADKVRKTSEIVNYNEKLDEANGLKKSVKPRKGLLAGDVARVKAFRKLDPNSVTDIDEYIRIGKELKEATAPNRRTKEGVSIQSAMDYKAVDDYLAEEQKNQEKYNQGVLKEVYDYLADMNLTTEEIKEIVSVLEEGKDSKLSDKRKKEISEALDTVKAFYNEELEDKLEFDESLTDKEKDIIRKLIDGDISSLYFAQKARVVNVIENILQNNSFADVANVINDIEVSKATDQIKGKKIKGIAPKIAFFKAAAKNYSQSIMTLTESMRNLFRGNAAANFIAEVSGMLETDKGLVNRHNRIKKITDNYNKMVSNMKGFNTSENIATRSFQGFMSRNDGRTPTEVKAEFERRKGILLEMEAHEAKQPNNEERASLTTKAIDNLGLRDAGSIEELTVSEDNKAIVDFFVNQFKELYPEHADVAERVFNKILANDKGYTPDIYESVDPSSIVDLEESVFFNDTVDTKSTSMLMDTSKTKGLPKNEKGKVTRTVSLDFDSQMMRKVDEAILEIETAASINKLNKFVETDNLIEFMDKDAAKVFQQKVISFIQSEKGQFQKEVDTQKDRKVRKIIDVIANTVAIKLLSSVFQSIKQVIPVAVRSLVHLKTRDAMGEMFKTFFGKNKKGMELATKYGTVAMRGKQSSVDIDNLNTRLKGAGLLSRKIADKLGLNTAHKMAKVLDKIADVYSAPLEYTLEKPDVQIAKASWVAYYKDKILSEGGKFDIDKELKSPNNSAIQYANSMVAQTQNESQASKMGDAFKSKTLSAKIVRNIVFPFANFLQALRSNMYNNVIIAASKSASREDRISALQGIAGAATEIVVFNYVSMYLRMMTDMALKSMLGLEDDDDDDPREFSVIFGVPMNKKEKRVFYTNIISDISPMPIADNMILLVVENINEALIKAKGEEYDKFKDNVVYAPLTPADIFLNDGGKFGTAYTMGKDWAKMADMADFWKDDDTYTQNSMFGSTEKETPYGRENDAAMALTINTLYMLTPSTKEVGTAAKLLMKDIENEGRRDKENEKSKGSSKIKVGVKPKISIGKKIGLGIKPKIKYKNN